MFLGHFGAGLASKPIIRQCSLGTLFLAAQWLDLLWPIFLLLGIERVQIDPGNTALTPLNFTYYPYTHSLVGALIWAVLFTLVYYVIRRNWKVSIVLGTLVLSHWVLDLVVHRPDLPITFGSEYKVGFGLWNSVILTLVVEGLVFLLGAGLYMAVTSAKDKIGRYGLLGLLAFLLIVYVLNVFGPPPDNVNLIAIAGMFQWLLIAWAYWVDRHRSYRSRGFSGQETT